VDRQLPSDAQQACEGAEQGITLDELQAALKLSARGKKLALRVLLPVLGGVGPRAASSSKALAFKLGHVRGNTMLTQWVVMVLNCNLPCHLQQCKCPDQDL